MGRSRNETISDVVLAYRTDTKSVAEAEKANTRVLNSLKGLDAAVAAFDQGLAHGGQIRAAQVTSLGTYNAALNESSQAALRAAQSERSTTQTRRDSVKAVDEYARAYREASQEARAFGDVSSNLTRVSGLARSVGLGGVADVGMIGSDIFDAVRGLEQLGPALRGVATQIQSGIQAATGFEVSLGAIGVASGVAVVALAAGAVALAAFTAANEEAVRGVQAYISAQRELANVLPGLSEDERIRRMEDLNATIQRNQERIDLLQRSYDQVTNGLGVLTVAADALNEQGIQDMRVEMERLRSENLELNLVLGELRGETGQAAAAATELAEAERRLAEERDSKARGAIETAIANARGQDEQALRQYHDAQLAALDANREAARFENEKRQLQERGSQQQQALRDSSSARVSQLRAAFDEFTARAEKQIESAQADILEKQAAINADYMADNLKASREYLREEVRQREDTNKALIRRAQDLADDLLSAEEANDVIRFIQTQRAGQKDLQRMSQDAGEAAQRRAEDFALETDERLAQRDQRLAEIRTEGEERIAEIRQGVRDQKRQLDEQVRQESVALKERLRLAAEALRAEINQRIAAHNASLNEEMAYNKARLTLQAQLNQGLADLQRQSYGQLAAQIRSSMGIASTIGNTLSYGGFGAGLYGGTSTPKGGAVVFNIQTGNIGSDLTQNQVKNSVQSGLAAFIQSTLNGMSAGVFKK